MKVTKCDLEPLSRAIDLSELMYQKLERLPIKMDRWTNEETDGQKHIQTRSTRNEGYKIQYFLKL